MASASALLIERERERKELKKRLAAFDRALEDLRRAKERLSAASDLYLERLEGTKRDAQRDR